MFKFCQNDFRYTKLSERWELRSQFVTTQVDRLKVDRLKEKTCATTQCQDRLDTLAGDCVMEDHYCPSVFSLQPNHLSSHADLR